MRNFDLTPLYRSTVGFDRFGSMLDQLLSGDAPEPSYPPYNIEKTGDDAYRITLAVMVFVFLFTMQITGIYDIVDDK